MRLEPLSDHVCVEPKEEQETRIGALIIPDTAKEKPQIGAVVAVGPGRRTKEGELRPLSVKEGDTVLYAKYGGTDFELDGKKLLILREADILAIVE